MSITTAPGVSFEATVDNAGSGLTGTITVRIEDGLNNIVTAASTTGIVESGTGIYTATRTAPSTAGQYLVIWNNGSAEASEDLTVTYTLNGVTGDPLCTLAQIDAILNRGGTSTDYTQAQKEAARAAMQEAFEHEANCAFTPRTETLTLDGPGTTDLLIPRPRVLACTAATVSDTALDTADVEAIEHDGVLYYEPGWAKGRRNVSVTVTHGWATTPADVAHAIAVGTSAILADGPWDDRGYAITDDGGSVRLLTAGVARASFSIPEVQAALNRHRYPSVR